MKYFRSIRGLLPAVLIGLFLLWAHWAVATLRTRTAPMDKKVVRIGHWQLEPGVRDALKQAADEYEKLHPDVMIIQDPIPESTYGQWVTCQLMGGTAPDIIEVGIGLPGVVWLGFNQRYFLPITSEINKPNPYNAGTPLEGVGWRQTFVDGMAGSYQQELQEFMRVPLAVHGFRILYNEDLLERLTGTRKPPEDFWDWINLCKKVGAQSNEKGRPYVPIASSAYHLGFWDQMLFSPAVAALTGEADFNRDGTLGMDELGLAIGKGRVDLKGDTFQSYLKMMRAVTGQFQRGFNGLTRDEAVFLFSQQRAVFILAGSFDLGGIREVAKGRFEIGVMNFPFPKKADPEFPGVLPGPRHEVAGGQFPFSVTRSSKHPDVALDFLKFLSSCRVNAKLNATIGWIPAVREAAIVEHLRGYAPSNEGLYGPPGGLANFGISGDSLVRWRQLLSLFQIGQIEAGQVAEQYQEFLGREVDKVAIESEANMRRQRVKLVRQQVFLRGIAMLDGENSQKEESWVRYRAGGLNRLTMEELYGQLMSGVRQGRYEADQHPYAPLGEKEKVWPFFGRKTEP